MKKIKQIVGILIALIMLSGCMNADIKYSIDEKYNVKLVYEVIIDTTNMNDDIDTGIRRIVKKLIQEYELEGFVLEGDYESEIMDFSLTLEEQADSYEDAYKKLEEILSNPKISYFLQIDLNMEVTEYEQAFIFDVETDFKQIIDNTTLNELPPTLRNTINEGIKESTINLSLSLPHINVVELSDGVATEENGRITTFQMPINFEGLTKMRLVGRMSLDENKVLSSTIDESIQKTEDQVQLYNVLFYVGIAGMIITALGLGVYLLRKKK